MENLAEGVKNFKNGVENVAEIAGKHPTNVRRALDGVFNSPIIREGALKFLKAKSKELQLLIAKEEKELGESKAA